MSYFPGIGITSPGRAMAPAAVEESASEIERSDLRLWLRGSDHLAISTQHGTPFTYAWSSKVSSAPMNYLFDNNIPSVALAAANGHNAADFRTQRRFVSAFDDGNLKNLSEITIIVVAKFEAAVTDIATFYSRESSSNPEIGFSVSPSVESGKQRLTFATWSAGSKTFQEIQSAGAMIPEQWQIFALTAKTQAKFYVDGELITTATINNAMGSVADSASRIYIGNNRSISSRFCDLIADVIVYNKELTEEQLAPIFTELKERYAIE